MWGDGLILGSALSQWVGTEQAKPWPETCSLVCPCYSWHGAGGGGCWALWGKGGCGEIWLDCEGKGDHGRPASRRLGRAGGLGSAA